MVTKKIGICIPLFFLFIPLAFAMDANTTSYTIESINTELVGTNASSSTYSFNVVGGMGTAGTGSTTSYTFNLGDTYSGVALPAASVSAVSNTTTSPGGGSLSGGVVDDEEEVIEEEEESDELELVVDLEESEEDSNGPVTAEETLDETKVKRSSAYYAIAGAIIGLLVLTGLILFMTKKRKKK